MAFEEWCFLLNFGDSGESPVNVGDITQVNPSSKICML